MQKNILITGGSSGIGKGLARHFHKLGWQVAVTGRNKQNLASIMTEMPGLHALEYDSAKDGQEENLVNFIRVTWGGRLDVLVNNAGHVELTPLATISRQLLDGMYRAHLVTPSLLTAACIEFLAQTKGQIVNISSSVGIKAYAQMSAYGSAKAGQNMLTKIWALELAPLGIRVNAVAPGPTDTAVLEKAGLSAEMIQMIHETEKAAIPLQRRGFVEDIVANTALLINSGSEWVTGVILPVDGGISIT